MRKAFMTIAAATSIAAATIGTLTEVEAECLGCWAGAGIAVGVIDDALVASNAYGYGYYGDGYSNGLVLYGYNYAPTYYTYASAPTAYYGSSAPVHHAPRLYAPRRYVSYVPYRRPYFAPRRVYVNRYYGRPN